MQGGIIRREALRQENSPHGIRIKAFNALYRNPGEPGGMHRHWAGDTDILWDNVPTAPTRGLTKSKWQFYDFAHWPEVVTDAVDAAKYEWKESKSGTPTPLALKTDVVGGAATLITGANAGDYCYYQAFQKLARGRQQKDFWFKAIVQISDVDRSQFYVGLCEDIASGDIFENRVNAVGFVKYDNEADITFEVRVGGAAQQAGEKSFVNATTVCLGLRYYSAPGHMLHYVNGANIGRIRVAAPDAMLPISFGLKNNASGAKRLTIKQLILAVELEF